MVRAVVDQALIQASLLEATTIEERSRVQSISGEKIETATLAVSNKIHDALEKNKNRPQQDNIHVVLTELEIFVAGPEEFKECRRNPEADAGKNDSEDAAKRNGLEKVEEGRVFFSFP